MTIAWRTGRPQIAAREFSSQADRRNGGKDSVLWHLEAGAANRAIGDYQLSNDYLGAAARQVDEFERRAKIRLGHETAAILSNQANLPYEGRAYDKIMLHTYRALNFLALGEPDRARPELIRAYQQQQDAVAQNSRRIENAKNAAANDNNKAVIDRSMADPGFNASLTRLYQPSENFQFFADYVNPFTVYLDGLFFLYDGVGSSDLERANKSLRRVAETSGANKFVQADLATAQALASGRPPESCTYVIIESGSAASRDQVRIDVPIIFANVSYVGAAFPRLVYHQDNARQFIIQTGNVQETALPVANMDSIITLDFKNELPAIVTKTLVSVVAKGVAAYMVNQAVSRQNEGLGLLTRIGTAIVQASVNIADTRSWTTLPKEFLVARVPTPPDRRMTLSAQGGASASVEIISGTINIVYVKSINASSPLLVSQFKLK